jgi:hypothetical protein
LLKMSSGIRTVINPAKIRPIKNQPAKSPQRSVRANLQPAFSFSPKAW